MGPTLSYVPPFPSQTLHSPTRASWLFSLCPCHSSCLAYLSLSLSWTHLILAMRSLQSLQHWFGKQVPKFLSSRMVTISEQVWQGNDLVNLGDIKVVAIAFFFCFFFQNHIRFQRKMCSGEMFLRTFCLMGVWQFSSTLKSRNRILFSS